MNPTANNQLQLQLQLQLQNISFASASRLASIAVKVIEALHIQLPPPLQPLPNSPNNLDRLRRVVAVFVACSAKASEARAKALPTLVLHALLFASRIVRKCLALSASPSNEEALVADQDAGGLGGVPDDIIVPQLSNHPSAPAAPLIPPLVLEMVRSPAKLFLIGLVLSEAGLFDSQTSTASWAKLLNCNNTSAANTDTRKHIADMKWAAFSFLNYDVTVSRTHFMKFCGVIRKWIGDSQKIPDMSFASINTNSTIPTPVALGHSEPLSLQGLASAVARSCVATAISGSLQAMERIQGAYPMACGFSTSSLASSYDVQRILDWREQIRQSGSRGPAVRRQAGFRAERMHPYGGRVVGADRVAQ